MPTPAQIHAQALIAHLLQRKRNLEQEKRMLMDGRRRVAEIDGELELIEADLKAHGDAQEGVRESSGPADAPVS
jgi:hypothetical protein